MAEQQNRPPLPKRKLRVVSFEVIGKTKDDNPIYRPACVTEQGEPVDLTFTMFNEPVVGELIEYGVKKFEHEKYGISYTLFPPKEKLGRRVEELEKRVAAIEAKLGSGGQPPPQAVPADPDTPQQQEAAAKFGGEDDIPF